MDASLRGRVTRSEHLFAPRMVLTGAGWGRLEVLADEPHEDAGAPADPLRPPDAPQAERSWQSLAVGLAVGIAVVLLLVAVALVTRGDGDDAAVPQTTGGGATASTGPSQTAPSTAAQPSGTAGPPTTRKPTPVAIVAVDDRRVVVLDQSGASAPRTLFDLGPSKSSDEVPPVIGGVSLSGDGTSAFFDVVGTPIAGLMKRVPVAGGPAQDVGTGVAPVPSPDGSSLASIQAPEPDEPATLVVRSIDGGSERRIDLGEGSCGNVAWSPTRREVAVDLCSGGEPFTVAIVDVATSGVRPLTPPDDLTWSVPAFKADGTLTLVEQRETDAAVVALNPEGTAVTSTILRRPSTSISTIDWSAAGDLLVCDTDGVIVAAIGGTRAQQVATGYTAAAW